MTQQSIINNYLEFVQLHERSIVITESNMEEYLLEISDNSKKVSKWIEVAEKELKKRYNISFDAIKRLGKRQGVLLQKEFKKKTPPEVLGKKISTSVKNMMVVQGKKAIQNVKDLTITDKIILSIITLIVIAFIQWICIGFLMTFVSSQTAEKVGGIVIAPMVEEASKTFFIKQGMPWVGTGIVYGIEAVLFVNSILQLGGKVGPTLILRGSGLLMHFATTYIQKQIIENGQEDETKALYIAWVAGVCIHSTYNIMAVVLNDQVIAALSK